MRRMRMRMRTAAAEDERTMSKSGRKTPKKMSIVSSLDADDVHFR